MKFEFEVHGLWIIGAVFLSIGVLILGNIEMTEGATPTGFIVSFTLAFLMIMLAGMFWISSAVNAGRR